MSARWTLRRLVQRLPSVRAVTEDASPLPLQPPGGDAAPPHLIDADVVEDATFHARRVPGQPLLAVAGFLDGAQESRVLGWSGAAPIVHGRVSAVIRSRVERRLRVWRRPRVRQRLYAPLAFTPSAALRRAFPAGFLCDTSAPDANGALPSHHPVALLERAQAEVALDRERIERALAEEWCETEDQPLLVDGGISGSEPVARSPWAIGVVKSHRSLYVSGDALLAVLAMRGGERSSVVRIAPRGREMVDSWYLRLRDGDGRGALFGLVRIEVATSDAPGARADEVSRWVLAERSPVALPDPRWDVMSYGVRGCEEFLRAIR